MPRHRGTRDAALSRRAFLGTAAATLGGVAATGTATAGDTATFPHVNTRDHFDITWYGDVYLTDGNTATNYATRGSIPGLDGSATDELFVHAHGWLSEQPDALESFGQIETALRNNGYDAPVIGYSWDSDTLYTRWWDATEIAERNGAKLAQFLYDYEQANPGTTIRICSHSLGARVTLRAVELLNENGLTGVVDSLTLLGGAADNDAVSTEGRYGPDVAAATGHTDNFYKTDDEVLEWAYSTAEFDSAVGEEGCEGPQPRNYTDTNVDDVPSHGDYYKPEDGCMDEVVATF
jgi:esterase/lipase superfamily enzyme